MREDSQAFPAVYEKRGKLRNLEKLNFIKFDYILIFEIIKFIYLYLYLLLYFF